MALLMTVGRCRYASDTYEEGAVVPNRQQSDPHHFVIQSTVDESFRNKGIDVISTEPAQGVTIVPDGTPATGQPGPAVCQADAANGPADFDG